MGVGHNLRTPSQKNLARLDLPVSRCHVQCSLEHTAAGAEGEACEPAEGLLCQLHACSMNVQKCKHEKTRLTDVDGDRDKDRDGYRGR